MKNLVIPEHYVKETAVKRGMSHMPWEASDDRQIEDSLMPSTDDPKARFRADNDDADVNIPLLTSSE